MLAAACAAGATALVCRNQAYAAEVEREIFSEDFDGKTFSDSWKDPVNAELQVGEYSMRYNGSSRWGSAISPMTHKITGDTDISFDIEVSGGGWISFVFGLPRYNSSIEYGDAGMWFWNNCTRLMDDGYGTLGGPSDVTMGNYPTYNVSPWSNSRTSLNCVITKTERRENRTALHCTIWIYIYTTRQRIALRRPRHNIRIWSLTDITVFLRWAISK